MSNQYWTKTHARYSRQDWINKPSIFAEFAVQYFPGTGRVLDLGAGQGQDSRFFAEQGFEVISTDFEDFALGLNETNIPSHLKKRIKVEEVDISEKLPFFNQEFDVVYSHLALHYFDAKTTEEIFREIKRVLKIGGIVAFMVNSTSDPEYQTGIQIEKDFFAMEKKIKMRFFNIDTVKQIANDFETILVDNLGESYKDSAVGVHNMIRYIGKRVE
ncbi:MAG: class I SAM-dependent methyltransferase [Patescibacteria group bacterium]|jgi:SAM-dependent methyltransferase